MKGQFFVMATVIMIYTLMTMIQYIYDFSDINLVQLKKTTELDYIQNIKDTLEQTIRGSNSSLDCNKVEIDLSSTEDSLERIMMSRGMNLTISHTILSCPPNVNVNFIIRIKSSNIYVEIFFNPISPNLVGHWKFEEGYGTLARDSSGYGNNGNLINMESIDWVSGMRGIALRFDGVNEYVDLGTNKFDYSSITVCAWINTTTSIAGDYRIFTSGIENTNKWTLTMHGSGYACFSNRTVWHATACSNSAINNGVWHHVCGISNPEQVYVDGVLQTSTLSDSWSFEANTKIGSRGTSFYFNGVIDEVKIWNRKLSASEIISEHG